jgi:hypothetical protein
MIRYFIGKRNKRKVAHLWVGTDTSCRMYTTGGIRQVKNLDNHLSDSLREGYTICFMCQKNWETYNGGTPAMARREPSPADDVAQLLVRLIWATSMLERLGKSNNYTLGMVRSIADCRALIADMEATYGEVRRVPA